ncbi:hypothetical protein ABT143_17330 [Streptomyces sp. NPDC002033]|uniref:hypothetical protein n=1 Tax=unclassified Streptomyces TaxID=2593676 RepID=UPI003318BC79
MADDDLATKYMRLSGGWAKAAADPSRSMQERQLAASLAQTHATLASVAVAKASQPQMRGLVTMIEELKLALAALRRKLPDR